MIKSQKCQVHRESTNIVDIRLANANPTKSTLIRQDTTPLSIVLLLLHTIKPKTKPKMYCLQIISM